MDAVNTTYEEYKALIAHVMGMKVSPYIESEVIALDNLAEKIDAIEEAHPEYEDKMCDGNE